MTKKLTIRTLHGIYFKIWEVQWTILRMHEWFLNGERVHTPGGIRLLSLNLKIRKIFYIVSSLLVFNFLIFEKIDNSQVSERLCFCPKHNSDLNCDMVLWYLINFRHLILGRNCRYRKSTYIWISWSYLHLKSHNWLELRFYLKDYKQISRSLHPS